MRRRERCVLCLLCILHLYQYSHRCPDVMCIVSNHCKCRRAKYPCTGSYPS